MFDTISPKELLHNAARKDYQLIDLRSNGDFQGRSIAGSINIPYAELPNRFEELSTEKQVVLICEDGDMSASARNFIMGYFRVQNIMSMESGIASLDRQLAVKKAG